MNQDDFGKAILIQDSLSVVAKEIINFALPRNADKLDILCLEKCSSKWRSVFVSFVDCNTHTDFKSVLEASKNRQMNLLIDSISQMAALTDCQSALNDIISLKKNSNVKKLIIVAHSDCSLIGPKMMKQLEYLCPTHFILKSKERNGHVVEICNSTAGGRIYRNVNNVFYDATLKRWICKEIKKELVQKVEKKPNSMDITSFKISVDKTANKIKKDLVLPYTEVINSSDNKVIQDFDIDDWDDEDPDDDLNI